MLQRTIKRQTSYYTLSLLFWHEMLFKYFFWGFRVIFGFLWQRIYFPSWNIFFSVRILATTGVEPYRRTNAPNSGSFTAKTSKDFPFTWSVETIKSPKLQMKVLSSAVKMTLSFLLKWFDANFFESDNFEEKNYITESFATNEINLHKQLIKSVQKLFLKHSINRTWNIHLIYTLSKLF